jgi:hypothetical protein
MAKTSRRSILGSAVLVMAIAVPAIEGSLARQPSPAAGPWSGQAQCVVVGKWTDYLDEQTHTWKLTGEAPTPAGRGSAQVFYTWPATWSVQGSGRKTYPSREPGGREQSERWTSAHETKMALRFTEIAGQTPRIRIGAEGQRGAPLGSLRVTEVSGRIRDASVQPWSFPAIEDGASNATVSGTSTKTYPEGFGVGWGQPPKAITTATCTWSFVRGAAPSAPQLSLGTPGRLDTPPVAPTETLPGARGRGSLSNATVPVPQARAFTVTGFSGRGVAAPITSRTFTMTGFSGRGVATPIASRTFTVNGFTGTGLAVSVGSRTFSVPGFRGVGSAPVTAPRR